MLLRHKARPKRPGAGHRCEGLVVEPLAALGIAAILEDRDRFAGRHVVTIVCANNVSADAFRPGTDPGVGSRRE
jgi:threonine dehydratase